MAAKYRRLTLGERKTIGQSLDQNHSLKRIARDIGRSAGTVSREIQRNSVQRKTGGSHEPFNECVHRATCTEQWLCGKEDCHRERCSGCAMCPGVCKRFEPEYCTRLGSPPYVCNGCALRRKCTLAKFVYKPSVAHKIYEDTLPDSRSGVALTEQERRRMDGIVTPLIRQGQSPCHICLNNKDSLMVSDKTLYKYISANFFGAASTDLTRKVGMRPRRKKRSAKVERSCRKGRTHEDLTAYLGENPDTEVIEMDSVIGAKGQGEKALLTILFTHSHFMLAFLRDSNTARSVKPVFDGLYEKFGDDGFRELFPVIRTDYAEKNTIPKNHPGIDEYSAPD